ncbi:MAG: hydroxymethylglutaryl-CoA lyase [Burkholderiales bacterium]
MSGLLEPRTTGAGSGGKAVRPAVRVTEVGTRDGFQAEPVFIPTAVKAGILDALIGAGVRAFEATSFVSPKAVPQLADADQLLTLIARRREARIAALVPNARGAERALAAGVDEMVCFVSASETHNGRNLNAPIERSLAQVAEVAALAAGHRVAVRGAVACAFGCPFEGEVPVESVLRVVDAYARTGIDRFTLGDTTGMATPPVVEGAVRAIRDRFPDVRIALHFHNTRGVGLANAMTGLALGVREYESSIGGLGGCPFAPGASGNVCTEDLVYLLEESGYDTGIDLEALIGVAKRVEAVVGRPLPGQLMKAGPRLRRYDADSVRRATG